MHCIGALYLPIAARRGSVRRAVDCERNARWPSQFNQPETDMGLKGSKTEQNLKDALAG